MNPITSLVIRNVYPHGICGTIERPTCRLQVLSARTFSTCSRSVRAAPSRMLSDFEPSRLRRVSTAADAASDRSPDARSTACDRSFCTHSRKSVSASRRWAVLVEMPARTGAFAWVYRLSHISYTRSASDFGSSEHDRPGETMR